MKFEIYIFGVVTLQIKYKTTKFLKIGPHIFKKSIIIIISGIEFQNLIYSININEYSVRVIIKKVTHCHQRVLHIKDEK